jgi:hypothetical protein
LLDFDRAELVVYAGAHRLAWNDDPMNLDPRFDRGWLRSRVLPAVRERWPSASATVARSASHLAEASRLLGEIAQADAAGLVDAGRLSLEGLARLSRDRQVNLVRACLASRSRAVRRAGGAADAATGLPDGAGRRRPGPALGCRRGPALSRPALRAASLQEALPARNDGGTSLELGPGCGRFALVGSGGRTVRGARRAAGAAVPKGWESLRPHPERPRSA